MRPRKIPEKKESASEAGCRKIATERGYHLLKWVSPGNSGIMDRILVAKRGVTIYMEFKRPSKELEVLQAQWATRFRRLGHSVYRIDSIMQFVGVLDEHDL